MTLLGMVRAVLFDLDGTLVDSLPGIEYSLREAIDAVCPGEVLPSAKTLIGPPVLEMFRIALPGADEATLEELQRAFRRSYDEIGYLKTAAYDGVKELLITLAASGVSLYVVTNKPPEAARRVLAHLGLASHFTRVVSTGDWLPERKTKSEATRWLLERQGLDGAVCVFVGDSPDDAEAARENAVAFLAAAYGYGGVAARPDGGTLASPGDLAVWIFHGQSSITREYS